MTKRKPTQNELEKVINVLIVKVEQQQLRLNNSEVILNEYIAWKKDRESFEKYLKGRLEEANKNRVRDSILNK